MKLKVLVQIETIVYFDTSTMPNASVNDCKKEIKNLARDRVTNENMKILCVTCPHLEDSDDA